MRPFRTANVARELWRLIDTSIQFAMDRLGGGYPIGVERQGIVLGGEVGDRLLGVHVTIESPGSAHLDVLEELHRAEWWHPDR